MTLHLTRCVNYTHTIHQRLLGIVLEVVWYTVKTKNIRSFTPTLLAYKCEYMTTSTGRQNVTMSLNYRIYSRILKGQITYCFSSCSGRNTSTRHTEGHIRQFCGSYSGWNTSTGHMEGHTRHCCGSDNGGTQIQNSQPVGNPLCGVQPCQPLLPDQHHPGTVAQDIVLMAATPSVETLLWLPAGQTQSPCEHDAGPLCVAQLAICGRMHVHYKKHWWGAALHLSKTRWIFPEGIERKQFRQCMGDSGTKTYKCIKKCRPYCV